MAWNLGYDGKMAVLWMAILPMVLWFAERLWPFPALVEESAKALVVYRGGGRLSALGLGLVFGFGEAVLFLINVNLLMTSGPVWQRLIFTVPMHGVTAAMTMMFGKRYWWLGLPLAMLAHWLFNLKIAS